MEGKKGRFEGVTYEPHIVGYFDSEPNVYLIKENKIEKSEADKMIAEIDKLIEIER